MQTIHAAAQDDDEQARFGSSRLGMPWYMGPGKEACRHAQ
jgi:hypothetical protein